MVFWLDCWHTCEDTPSRPHATTTTYDPSPPRRATTTHVTTQVKTPRSPIALYSKSLNCNLGIFLIFFLTRLRYRPFSIGEIISHVLRSLALEPEISLSLLSPCILYCPFFHWGWFGSDDAHCIRKECRSQRPRWFILFSMKIYFPIWFVWFNSV